MGQVTCVVCGQLLEEGRVYTSVKYRKGIYHICCPICLQIFNKSRERYVDNGVEPDSHQEG